MPDTVSFRLNGQPVRISVAPDRTLLWVQRTDRGLTGTKFGCGIVQCGACTVLVDHRAVIHEHGAGAALDDAAAKFRPSQPTIGSLDPKQGPVWGDADPHWLPVEAKGNCVRHWRDWSAPAYWRKSRVRL